MLHRQWFLPVLSLLVLCGSALAQDDSKKDKQQSRETYQVVEVDGAVQVKKSSEIKAYQEALEEEYAAARKAWEEARKQAKKDKQEFTEPAPTKPKVKVHGKKHKTEAEAKAAADKRAKEIAEKKKKKKKGGGGS